MLHLTEHKNGLKMAGFISLNVSVLNNEYCRVNRTGGDKCICTHCYGAKMERIYPRLKECLIKNSIRLSRRLSDDDIKEISEKIQEKNRHYIRFNSIGELMNKEHLDNLYRICDYLPDHFFGLWSKRIDLIRGSDCARPGNLSLIYSNSTINKPIERIPAGELTGVFNVVSYDYATKNPGVINCQGSCVKCLKCYQPKKYRPVVYELLKKDQVNILKGFKPPVIEGSY